MANYMDIQKWNRASEIAKQCGVVIKISGGFRLEKKDGKKKIPLGVINSVDELYAFMCGFEHSI